MTRPGTQGICPKLKKSTLSVYENLRKYFMTVRTAQTCKWSSDNRHWIKFPPPPPLTLLDSRQTELTKSIPNSSGIDRGREHW